MTKSIEHLRREVFDHLTYNKQRSSPLLDFFRFPVKDQSELSKKIEELLDTYEEDGYTMNLEVGFIWCISKDERRGAEESGLNYYLDYYGPLYEDSLDTDLLDLIKRNSKNSHPTRVILGLASVRVHVEKTHPYYRSIRNMKSYRECECNDCFNDLVQMSITDASE